MTIRNKNIIQFYHHDYSIQVMDFADGGTLASNIKRIGEKREDIAVQIRSGLVYLHSLDFIHKKIKTSNILLTRNFDAKIAGFGSDITDCNGDEDWMAPELRSDVSKHSVASDIYALGVVMKEMGEGSKDYMQCMIMYLDDDPCRRSLKYPIVEAPKKTLARKLGVEAGEQEPLEELKVIARGNGEVAHHLGIMYDTGGEGKVSIDKDEALAWYLMAASLGHREAQCIMGVHYHDRGDDTAAESWYSKAARQGHPKAWSKLGGMFFSKRRYAEALENYSKAESAGDVRAQYWLGEIYYQQLDDVLAFGWFHKAAVQGDVDAEYSVGYMYHHGRGVARSFDEAEKWYLTAIEKGHAPAQKHLEMPHNFTNM
ncbi:hypothetical protein EC957_000158 [Mortierella hygrophila]|uniref:Protein kinase domain-containing protein n=1 Tax=Mortierella hygrophila TaxID=979708 RepID=A0A9P6FHR4_9FUNG|nr:hypothetical protein EC957_000158 [Mortierella hygrophila]